MNGQGVIEFDSIIKLNLTLPDRRIHSRLILYCLDSAMNLSKGGLSLSVEGSTSHSVWVQKQNILNDRCGSGPLATSISKLSSQSGLYAWKDDAYIVRPSHGTTALFLWEWWLGIQTILPSWCLWWDLHSLSQDPWYSCLPGIAYVMGYSICKARGSVEMDKGDIPIWKEYLQLWYMQGMPYALYDNYAYVTLWYLWKYVVTSRCPPCI